MIHKLDLKQEDHWSCIAHLSDEDMLNSAVIEETNFKHRLWVGGRQPIGTKHFMSTGRPHHYIASLKRISSTSDFIHSFHDLINVYSHRSGADNPRGQTFDVNRNLWSLRSFATGLKKNSLYDFIQFFS